MKSIHVITRYLGVKANEGAQFTTLPSDEATYRRLMMGTARVLSKSQKEKEPYMGWINGIQYVVMPGVFPPTYFQDTAFFAKEVPKRVQYVELGGFLEMGCGTGVVTCEVIKRSMRVPNKKHPIGSSFTVHAADINPIAVRNTRINRLLHDPEGNCSDVYESDLFDTLPGNGYNTIFWNIPFGDWGEQGKLDLLHQAVWDPGYKNLRRFGEQCTSYLGDNGNLLIGFSTTLGKFDVLQEILKQNRFQPPKIVAQSGYEREGNPNLPVKFELLETRLM
ncbi:MAG: methyltransferase [Candidatus Pacearchaeota archaeon]|jgi:methylase of polypeptide subunit release factors